MILFFMRSLVAIPPLVSSKREKYRHWCFKKKNYRLLREDIKVFYKSNSSNMGILEHEKRILLKLYNSPCETQCIAELRRYQYKSSFLNKNRDVDLKCLCPSEYAIE